MAEDLREFALRYIFKYKIKMNAPVEYLIYKINILKKCLLFMVIGIIVGLFWDKNFSFGFFVGSFIAIANFSLLSKYVLQMRDMSIKAAQRFIILRFLLMYVIMAVVLFSAVKKDMITFLAVALGLIIVKVVIFVDNFTKKQCLQVNS
ncbi:MAG: ATP synthase subunit I [Candidatus Omnitrophica bacterium]|nr:ATP synthase subunit I [Candidatus Omnitrophota bacterium]